ncbi:MAG: BrnT family toxin [Gemmatimonadales bacterium]|nr:BrnT family toxin [Gemmatimonadales bacterium]
MAYEFEWSPTKAAANYRKHGVTFEEAVAAFADSFALLLPDPAHSEEEERYLALGQSDRNRLIVVSFAERPPRTRLISARLATRREHRHYEEAQS